MSDLQRQTLPASAHWQIKNPVSEDALDRAWKAEAVVAAARKYKSGWIDHELTDALAAYDALGQATKGNK